MQPFPIKTISLRQCNRCKITWSSENEKLEAGDQINIVMVKIGHCPACAEGFAAEIDRPMYERTGKRVK